MSYLGRSAKLSLKAQEKVSFLATAGQTAKTGLSYVPNFVEVYVNGILLTDTTDFTATNGNSVTFTVALALNDEVTVVSLKTFTVADHYTKSDANTLLATKAPIASPVFTGNVGVGATPASWASPAKALQVGSTASLAEWNNGSSIISIVGSNSYFNSGYKYSTTNTAAMIRLSNGSMDFRVAASGSAGAAITFNTGLEVMASGKARAKNGLLFGTDSAASNTLDDYEEGTWTPTIGGNSTYTNQVGRYIKIGNMVWVNFAIGINAQGSGSTISQISGLPVTSGLASQNTSNLTWHGLGVAMTYGVYYVGANSTTLSLSYTTGASTQLTNNPNSLVNGASMNGTFVYTI